LEALTTSGTKLNWISDTSEVFCLARHLKQLNEQEILQIFGVFNGICHRALRRIDDGHYNPCTLQCCRATLKDGNEPCLLFKIQVTASLKASCYWVILVFEDKSNGCYIPAPASRCECSHMLGLVVLLQLIQSNTSWDKVDFACALPPPIKSIQTKPIPWVFVFGKDNEEALIHRNAKVFVYSEESNEKSDCEEIEEMSLSDEAIMVLAKASSVANEDDADLDSAEEVENLPRVSSCLNEVALFN
jgi:hypothetical protein